MWGYGKNAPVTTLILCRAGVQAYAGWQSLGRADPAGSAHPDSGRIARWADAVDPERALVRCIPQLSGLTPSILPLVYGPLLLQPSQAMLALAVAYSLHWL